MPKMVLQMSSIGSFKRFLDCFFRMWIVFSLSLHHWGWILHLNVDGTASVKNFLVSSELIDLRQAECQIFL